MRWQRVKHWRTLFHVAALGVALSAWSPGAVAATPGVRPDRLLKGHTDGVTAVAFFPDGVRAASASLDKTVKIWDVTDGRLLRTIEGHGAAVRSVSVSPDGKWIASGSADHTARVWDAKTGAQVAQLEGHRGTVHGAAFRPDGTLLTGAEDGLRLWDVAAEKVTWKSYEVGLGVFRMTLSGDGKRAAFVGRDGRSYAWELDGQRRRLATGGGSKRMHPDIALNADGSEMYGTNGPDGVVRWEVATGKTLPMPEEMKHAHFLYFFPDGRRVVSYETILVIRDMQTMGPPIRLANDFASLANCAAVSPDGKTVIVGTGGFPDMDRDRPDDHNEIAVYTVPGPNAPAASGPPAGKLSWEDVAARVRTLDGRDVAFADWRPPNEFDVRQREAAARGDPFGDVTKWPMPDKLKVKGLVDGLDVFWTRHVVLFHEAKGALREVLKQDDAGYWDAAWDGRNVWVASTHEGLLVLDRTGKLVTKIGAAQGLPPTEARLIVSRVGPGRVLAAGQDWRRADPGKQSANWVPDSGWCAEVRWDGTKATVNVVVREPQVKDAWGGPFAPAWIVEGPPPAGWARAMWVGTRDQSTVLRVDPETLKFETYNVTDRKQRRGIPPLNLREAAPYWPGGQEVIVPDGGGVYRFATDGATLDRTRRKLLASLDTRGSHALIPSGGQLYAPGPRWMRIDPRTQEAEALGPGLRIDEKLVEHDVTYFNSKVIGLAALPESGNRLFRFSTDPKSPLPVRATADGPGGRALPPRGVVERSGDAVSFYRGRGAIRFKSGVVDPKVRAIEFPWANPRVASIAAAEAVAQILWHAGAEQERVGMTPEQAKAVRAVKRAPAPLDGDRLKSLYAAYEAAAPGPAQDKAADALLEQAAAQGEAEAKAEEAFVAQVKGVFSARQWKLLNYELPTAADDATIPAVAK